MKFIKLTSLEVSSSKPPEHPADPEVKLCVIQKIYDESEKISVLNIAVKVSKIIGNVANIVNLGVHIQDLIFGGTTVVNF